jgi:hypothetical protein
MKLAAFRVGDHQEQVLVVRAGSDYIGDSGSVDSAQHPPVSRTRVAKG